MACDSLASILLENIGIGKSTVVKVLERNTFVHFGDLEPSMNDVIEEATKFIGACYRIPTRRNMSDKR